MDTEVTIRNGWLTIRHVQDGVRMSARWPLDEVPEEILELIDPTTIRREKGKSLTATMQ